MARQILPQARDACRPNVSEPLLDTRTGSRT
jgi:hypothetical protein